MQTSSPFTGQGETALHLAMCLDVAGRERDEDSVVIWSPDLSLIHV